MVEAGQLQDGQQNAYQRPAGDEARGDESPAVHPLLGEDRVLGRFPDEVGDEPADEERGRERQGEVHAQGEGQGRYLGQLAGQGDADPDPVEGPGHGLARHQRLDDRGHEVGLGRGERPAAEGEGPVEDVDRDPDHEGRDEHAGELEALLVAGRGSQPVADLEVGDEASGQGEGRADHGPDEQGDAHALGAAEARSDQDDASGRAAGRSSPG